MSAPETFGRYLLLARRPASPYGDVREAELVGTGIRVALTRLAAPPEPAVRDAWQRDLRAAAAVRSAHVAPVVDAGERDGVWWVAHQDVPGARPVGALPPAAASAVAEDLRRALADLADAPGGPLVHGAIGPDTARVGSDGRVVLGGLGMRALLAAPAADAGGPERVLAALGTAPDAPAEIVTPALPPAAEAPLPTGRDGLVDRVRLQLADGVRCFGVRGPSGSGHATFVRTVAARAAHHVGPLVRVAMPAAGPSPVEALVWAVAAALGVEPDPAARPAGVGRALGRRGRTALLLEGVDPLGDELSSVLEDWLAAAPELVVFTTGAEAPAITFRTTLPPLAAADVAGWFSAGGPAEPAALDALVHATDGIALGLAALAACGEPVAALAERVRGLRELAGDAPDAGLLAALDVAVDAAPPWARTALFQLAAFEGAPGLPQLGAGLDLGAFADPAGAPFAPEVVSALTARRMLRHERGRWRVPEGVRRWARARASPLQQELDRLRHREVHRRLGSPNALRALADGRAGFRSTELLPELEDVLVALERAVDEPPPNPVADADSAALLEAAAAIGGAWLPPRRALGLGDRVAARARTPAERARCERLLFPLAAVVGRAGEGASRRDAALAAAAGDVGLRIALHLRAGRVEDVEQAVALARGASDPQLAEALVARAELFARVGRRAAAREALAEALATPGADRAVSARASLLRGRLAADAGEPGAAVAAFEDALRDLHLAGRAAGRAAAEAGRGAALVALGRLEDAVGELAAAAATARARGDLAAEAETEAALGEAARWSGRFDAAARHLDEAEAIARHVRDPDLLARIRVARGDLAAEAGSPGEAAMAYALARDLGPTRARGAAELGLCALDADAGADPAALRPRLLAALAEAKGAGDRVAAGRALGALGLASARLGEPETARARLEGAVDELDGRSFGGWLEAARLLGEGLRALGDPDAAAARLDAAISKARGGRFGPALARLLLARAALLRVQDRAVEAASDEAEAALVVRGLALGPAAPLSRAVEAAAAR